MIKIIIDKEQRVRILQDFQEINRVIGYSIDHTINNKPVVKLTIDADGIEIVNEEY